MMDFILYFLYSLTGDRFFLTRASLFVSILGMDWRGVLRRRRTHCKSFGVEHSSFLKHVF